MDTENETSQLDQNLEQTRMQVNELKASVANNILTLSNFNIQNRESNYPNRRAINIVSQSANKIIADIEYADEVKDGKTGTALNSSLFQPLKETTVKTAQNTNSALDISLDAKSIATQALKQVINDLGSVVYVNGSPVDEFNATQELEKKLDKITYQYIKENSFGESGILHIGKFKVYDSNITIDISSTTSVTHNARLVIATQNHLIMQANVYMDETNTVAPNIFMTQSSADSPYIDIYFKASGWSKNIVEIKCLSLVEAPTELNTTVTSVPQSATLQPKNVFDNAVKSMGTQNWKASQNSDGSLVFSYNND